MPSPLINLFSLTAAGSHPAGGDRVPFGGWFGVPTPRT